MEASEREDRIVETMEVVYIVARQILRSWPGIEDPDELVGDGMIGAIKAVDSYREDGGANLKTYAYIRIRGEMLDGMRTRHGRKESHRARAFHYPIDAPSDQDGLTLLDILPDDDDAITRTVDALVLHEALQWLPDEDATVLWAYYFDHRTLMDIAIEQGVTESRMSQKLLRARTRMYRILTADGTEELA